MHAEAASRLGFMQAFGLVLVRRAPVQFRRWSFAKEQRRRERAPGLAAAVIATFGRRVEG